MQLHVFLNCFFFTRQNIFVLFKIFSGVASDIWPHNMEQIYFKCFKLSSDGNWELVFNTPRINSWGNNDYTSSCLTSISNEMLINVFDPDKHMLHCSFIVDMNEYKPVATPIFPNE